MTLPIGTALQNGTYVIDAWGGEDAIGPMYLATDVPHGQWAQIRILGSRHPEAIPSPAVRAEFYDYLKAVQALKQPMLSAQIAGFEEDGVCYQALATPLGTPLSTLVTSQVPLPPRQSLSIIYSLVKALVALRPLGWAGLTLTPDQLWQRSRADDLVFTGFDLPSEPAATGQEPALVKDLSRLLYFLLTGQRAETTQAPLAVDLRRRYPTLPLGLDAALQLGSPQNPQLSTVTLAEWVARLPALSELPPDPPQPQTAPRPVRLPASPQPTSPTEEETTQVVAARTALAPEPFSNQQPSHLPVTEAAQVTALAYTPAPLSAPGRAKSSPWANWGLLLTALVAGAGGLSFGLQARLQPLNTTTNPTRLNPGQSFPPLSDWPGEASSSEWNQFPGQVGRPDYGEAPPRRATPDPVVAPAPTNTPNLAPIETLDPEPAPAEDLDPGAGTMPPSEGWPNLTPQPGDAAPTPIVPGPALPPWKEPEPMPSSPTPVAPPAPLAPAPVAPPAPLAPAPVAPPVPLAPAPKTESLAPPAIPPRPPAPASS